MKRLPKIIFLMEMMVVNSQLTGIRNKCGYLGGICLIALVDQVGLDFSGNRGDFLIRASFYDGCVGPRFAYCLACGYDYMGGMIVLRSTKLGEI